MSGLAAELMSSNARTSAVRLRKRDEQDLGPFKANPPNGDLSGGFYKPHCKLGGWGACEGLPF